MRCICSASNQKFVILFTVFNAYRNDARNGIDYCICIISISMIFHCNCTTTHLSYVNIFTAVMA